MRLCRTVLRCVFYVGIITPTICRKGTLQQRGCVSFRYNCYTVYDVHQQKKENCRCTV